MRRFEVSREPEHEGHDSLHGNRKYAPDDFVVLVDRERIGGTYWGGAYDGPGKWHSYGPAGLSMGHRSREAAEQAQVREYATNPDCFDRRFAMDQAEREAEIARRDAERERESQREPWERGPDAYRSGTDQGRDSR